MMTLLEEQLVSANDELVQRISRQLEEKLMDCRRRLLRGAGPGQYKQWQQEAEAIQAAQDIFNTLRR